MLDKFTNYDLYIENKSHRSGSVFSLNTNKSSRQVEVQSCLKVSNIIEEGKKQIEEKKNSKTR